MKPVRIDYAVVQKHLHNINVNIRIVTKILHSISNNHAYVFIVLFIVTVSYGLDS